MGGQPSAGHLLKWTQIAEACGYETMGHDVTTKEELIERNSDVVVRPAEILLEDVITELCSMNRVRRRNLEKLLRPATRGR